MSTGRTWWVLVGSCLGLFVLMFDSTEVVLALPVIDKDLGLSEAGLQWVQNAYLLTLAATVITCGRLGDILGRRRVFIGGVVVFAVGSLVAALSTGEEMLIGATASRGLRERVREHPQVDGLWRARKARLGVTLKRLA